MHELLSCCHHWCDHDHVTMCPTCSVHALARHPAGSALRTRSLPAQWLAAACHRSAQTSCAVSLCTGRAVALRDVQLRCDGMSTMCARQGTAPVRCGAHPQCHAPQQRLLQLQLPQDGKPCQTQQAHDGARRWSCGCGRHEHETLAKRHHAAAAAAAGVERARAASCSLAFGLAGGAILTLFNGC